MFPLFLRLLYKHESDKNERFLSVVVVCSASTAYISLCRGMKYLLKIHYFIQNYANMNFFLFPTLFFVPGLKYCRMSEKISQK